MFAMTDQEQAERGASTVPVSLADYMKATEQSEHWYRLWANVSEELEQAKRVIDEQEAAGGMLVREGERLRADLERVTAELQRAKAQKETDDELYRRCDQRWTGAERRLKEVTAELERGRAEWAGWDEQAQRMAEQIRTLTEERDRLKRDDVANREWYAEMSKQAAQDQSMLFGTIEQLAQVRAERDAMRERASLLANAAQAFRNGRHEMGEAWLARVENLNATRKATADAAEEEK